jgi:hypothetical protein
VSLTFGDRFTILEEKVASMAQVLEALLQGLGLVDEEGNWVESDESAAEPRD